jgi:hypothetical protein
MQVGRGPNWGCSAKKKISFQFNIIMIHPLRVPPRSKETHFCGTNISSLLLHRPHVGYSFLCTMLVGTDSH